MDKASHPKNPSAGFSGAPADHPKNPSAGFSGGLVDHPKNPGAGFSGGPVDHSKNPGAGFSGERVDHAKSSGDAVRMLENFGNELQCRGHSALALAVLGDAVLQLLAIINVMSSGEDRRVADIHRSTTGIVNARAQAQMYLAIQGQLSQAERDVMRRGRNANSGRGAKNASVAEYKRATGLESLFGYLMVLGEYERILEIFHFCVTGMDEDEKKE